MAADQGTVPLRFYVATHKAWPLPRDDGLFTPIGCGGYGADHPGAVADDTGVNISSKNAHYSELTGWYWIWKNVADADVVGVCHYRRYFFLHPGHQMFGQVKLACAPSAENIAFLTHPQCASVVAAALNGADVIVPRREDLGMSLAAQYRRYHPAEDWDLFIEAIKATDSSLFRHVGIFDRVRHAHLYNMMIARKGYFDRYMEALFAVTDWMERQKPFRRDAYQCRVPAFLAERFFNLYLAATAARCFEVPVAFTPPPETEPPP